MRLVSYLAEGRARLGVRAEAGILDSGFADLRDYLERGYEVGVPLVTGGVVEPVRLLAPVAERCQVIYTGGNYRDHLAEVSHLIKPVEPVFFPGLWSAVIGPGDPIVIPSPDTKTDYEVELAVVISRTARKVAAEDAWSYVLGFTVVNDVSARDVMQREALQIMLCKSPDTFCPIGPEIVTLDEIEDLGGRAVTTRVNGVLKQNATTDDILVTIPELLEFLTRTVTLYPGDVLTTGTPGGVGAFRDPPEFLAPGDVVTVAVEGIGELSNPLVAGWMDGPTQARPDALAGS